jgi:hypothetical protein
MHSLTVRVVINAGYTTLKKSSVGSLCLIYFEPDIRSMSRVVNIIPIQSVYFVNFLPLLIPIWRPWKFDIGAKLAAINVDSVLFV